MDHEIQGAMRQSPSAHKRYDSYQRIARWLAQALYHEVSSAHYNITSDGRAQRHCEKLIHCYNIHVRTILERRPLTELDFSMQ